MSIEREAFESVFTEAKGWDLTFIMGCYQNIETLRAFAGWQAAKAQAVPEGFVLIPKKMPDEVNDHLWDFMTDNFVCTNDYGDSFMACDDFNLDKFYAELIKAQEPK